MTDRWSTASPSKDGTTANTGCASACWKPGAIGAWCVRKFWVQRPTERPRPQTLELGGVPEVLVDDYCFEVVEGMRFLPAAIDNAPGPMIASTEPHENRGLYVESIERNAERERYESVYRNALETYEDAPTGAERAGLRMRRGQPGRRPSGRSRASASWTYAGSTDNNILRDETGDPTTAEGRLAADLARRPFASTTPGATAPSI